LLLARLRERPVILNKALTWCLGVGLPQYNNINNDMQAATSSSGLVLSADLVRRDKDHRKNFSMFIHEYFSHFLLTYCTSFFPYFHPFLCLPKRPTGIPLSAMDQSIRVLEAVVGSFDYDGCLRDSALRRGYSSNCRSSISNGLRGATHFRTLARPSDGSFGTCNGDYFASFGTCGYGGGDGNGGSICH